jgi:hypothetical protein
MKPLYGSSPNSWDLKALERSVQGITAVLLSLKKKPVIRYEKMSGMAKKLGVEIQVSLILCPSTFIVLMRLDSIVSSPNRPFSIFVGHRSLLSCSYLTDETIR